jgi:hypothetical protein
MRGPDAAGPSPFEARRRGERLRVTGIEAAAQFSNLYFKPQTHLRVLAARFARALLDLSTLLSKRAQGRPGADIAPAVRCAKM